MNDTKPNAELAYADLDHIDAHPEDWNQREWWCGTGGCFAGLACVLSGEIPTRTGGVWRVGGKPIAERAAELLRIDDVQEFELFSAYNTREDLGRIVTMIFGPRPGQRP